MNERQSMAVAWFVMSWRNVDRSRWLCLLFVGLFAAGSYSARQSFSEERRIATVFGTGVATPNEPSVPLRTNIGNPFGVEIGPHGDLFVCEVTNHRVWRLDKGRDRAVIVAGTGQPGYSGDNGPATAANLNEPYEVRFASNGDMYFVEMRNHIVRCVNAQTGRIETIAGDGSPGFRGDGGQAVRAQLNQPHSIALSDNFLYIADIGNHRIRRVNLRNGIIDTLAGNGKKSLPVDHGRVSGQPVLGPRALFLQGNSLWVALREGHSIWKLDLESDTWFHVAGTGQAGYSGDGELAESATLNGPKGLVVAGQRVHVVDTENQAIRTIELDTRRIITLAGGGPERRGFAGEGSVASAANLNRPHGICIDDRGSLFIGDSENHRVRVILP